MSNCVLQEQLVMEGLELVCSVCDAELDIREEEEEHLLDDEGGIEGEGGGEGGGEGSAPALLPVLPQLLAVILPGEY
jgi:hypothetical protein